MWVPRLETPVTRQLAPGRKGWQKLSFEYFTFHKQPSPRRLCCNIMQSLAFSPHRQRVLKVVYLQTSIAPNKLFWLFRPLKAFLELAVEAWVWFSACGRLSFLVRRGMLSFPLLPLFITHLYFYRCWPPKKIVLQYLPKKTKNKFILEWKSGCQDVAFSFVIWFGGTVQEWGWSSP